VTSGRRCAGCAGEEIIYGGDEVSTINQRRLVMARRIVSKLVVSNAMSDAPELAHRMISHPVCSSGRSLRQIILRKVPSSFIYPAALFALPAVPQWPSHSLHRCSWRLVM
jgi:hypothetical protein